MSERKGMFAALYRNEVEKLMAHRGRLLWIAFLVIVLGGSFLVYHGQASQRQMMAQNLTMARQQVNHDRQALKHATGINKSALKSQLRADEKNLQQMQQQNGAQNEVQLVKELKANLRQTPKQNRGSALEQVATAQYLIDHGMTEYNPSKQSGYRLVGDIFGGTALLIFALLAVGIGADRISQEVEAGTWGGLLLHAPVRTKIYLAKLCASLTVVFGFVIASAVVFFLLGSLLFGLGSPMVPHVVGIHLTAWPGTVPPQLAVPVQAFHIIPQWLYDLSALGLALVALSVLTAMMVALSMAFRSTIVAFIAGALLVISGVLTRSAGSLAVIDPATHIALIEDWTGALAFQMGMKGLTLGIGLLVVGCWALAAIGFGVLWAKRLDV